MEKWLRGENLCPRTCGIASLRSRALPEPVAKVHARLATLVRWVSCSITRGFSERTLLGVGSSSRTSKSCTASVTYPQKSDSATSRWVPALHGSDFGRASGMGTSLQPPLEDTACATEVVTLAKMTGSVLHSLSWRCP